MKPWAALLVGLSVASCAADPDVDLSSAAREPMVSDPAVQAEALAEKQLHYAVYQKDLEAVWRVGDKLSVANAALCRNRDRVAYQSGIHIATLATTPGRYQKAARAEFPDIANAATVLYVDPDSAAARAGIDRGDIIEAVNHVTIPSDDTAPAAMAAAVARAGAGSSEVTLKRGATTRTVAVAGALACNYPVIMVDDDAINSYTNKEGIFIDRGMLAQLRTDDEIAVVIGHEMGHNISGQVDGGLGLSAELAFGGNGARVPLEEEADYIGAYAVARAGFDVDMAPKMWQRLAVTCMPGAIDATTDHPSFPVRIVMLRREVAEIKGKMASGAPLIPDDRAVAAVAAPSPVSAMAADAQGGH